MNFSYETYQPQPLPGVGTRIDFNLTPEDAIEGVFLDIQVAATVATTAPTAAGGVVQVDTLTFPTKAAIGDSDYVVLTDTNGDEWAAAAQLYPAAVAQDEDLTFVDFATITDGEYVIITDQSGTEWAIAADKTGASAAPVGARWGAIAAANKAQVDLSAAVTDEDVADAFLAAFNLLAGFNVVVTLADEAGAVVSALQVVAGACASAESLLQDDSAAGNVTIATVTAGADATVAPTGARWAAVPAAQRTQVDLSAAVTENDVATAFKNALDVLAGATLTLAVALTDMSVTQPARGAVANPVPLNFDDSGVGTITTAVTTPGVDSAVDITADTITITDPGWLTGKPVVPTSTGALPGPLVSGTTYYVIRSAAGVYQLATSLANALAGTEINLVDQGDAGATITLTASGPTIGYLFHSLTRLSDAAINTAILTNSFHDLNTGAANKPMIAQLGFDFSKS